FSSASEKISGIKKFNSRNVLPLFNLAWYTSLFWDGRVTSIEEQIFHPVRNQDEMKLMWSDAVTRIQEKEFYRNKFQIAFNTTEVDSLLIAKAIAQFLRTLISYQSKYDRVLNGEEYFTKDEYQGFILMNDMTKGDCLHCHSTDSDALGTFGTFSNNGLDEAEDTRLFTDKGLGGYTNKINDYGKFKIPSLRNLVFTAPYMHDGRFNSLEEVLNFYSEGVKKSATIDSKMGFVHQGGVNLNLLEKQQIILFLKTLSDSTFIAKPEFINPFNESIYCFRVNQN
ncbi:MAG: cytochrome-c peroxidase, partial [Bacteroidia bacterium]